MVTVRVANSEDAVEWDKFVLRNGTFFHRFGWSSVINNTYGHTPIYLLAEQNDQLIGVLPLINRRSTLFGNSLISVGFTVGGGVVATTDEAKNALLLEAQKHAESLQSDYIELRSASASHEGWHEKHGIYDNFCVRLVEDRDQRLTSIPRKKRADIRKAIKKADQGEIEIKACVQTGEFWHHYAKAQRDHGTPVFPKKWLSNQLAAFGSDLDIHIVWGDGQPLAGVMSYYHQDTVHLYNAFISPLARKYHAGDYLYWWMMEHALEKGMKTFDLGRSKRGTGAHAYKTYWGIEPKPLVYLYKLIHTDEMPNINPQNPKFAFMSRMWRHLPLPIANQLGPKLAGHLA